MVVAAIVAAYQYVLAPVAPFTWFGLNTSTIDLVAIIRLCFALRQMRESLRREYDVRARRSLSVSTTANGDKDGVVTLVERPNIPPVEGRSFVRDALATLLVVYGGEAMICTFFLLVNRVSLTLLYHPLYEPRSVYLRSAFVRFLRSDSSPLRPRPDTRRGTPGVSHSDAHIHHRASAVPPGRVYPCDPAMHPHPADRTK